MASPKTIQSRYQDMANATNALIGNRLHTEDPNQTPRDRRLRGKARRRARKTNRQET